MLRFTLAIVLSALLVTCSRLPSHLEQIESLGEIVFVTRNSPATYYLGPEQPRGLEYELARGFADRLGVDLVIEPAARYWQIFESVASGGADVGAAGLTVTEERFDLVDFGPVYLTSSQQLVYRRGTPRPSSLGDLVGGRLEIVAGSSVVGTLEAAGRYLPDLEWIENAQAGTEDLVRRVATGKIDYTIVDSNLFALLRQYHPEARAAFAIGEAEPIAWALPKGANGLREEVAAYFAEIHATGKLSDIVERNYFAAQSYDYVGSRAFMRHVKSRLPSYIDHFKDAAEETGFDWRLLAAVAYQESHWNPKAVSPTGVRGMMMLTKVTADIVDVEDRNDAKESIVGGARYLARVRKKVPARIDEPDRLWLAVAAYNIGFGHLEDARIITEIHGADPDSWEDVRRHLPLLSDEEWFSRVKRGYARGDVPVVYVDNIRRYYELLLWVMHDDGARDDAGETIIEPPPTTASSWTLFNLSLFR